MHCAAVDHKQKRAGSLRSRLSLLLFDLLLARDFCNGLQAERNDLRTDHFT
jgi:hypothetical protein